MKNKRIYLFIIVLALLAFISFFGKSYVEEKNLEIKELKSVIIKKDSVIESKNKEILEVQKEYFKLEDKFNNYKESVSKKIVEIKNKDGSSKKIIEINNKKESSSGESSKEVNKENTKIEKDSEESSKVKESVNIKENKELKQKEYKKVESGLKPLLYIGGGILICVLSGICVF